MHLFLLPLAHGIVPLICNDFETVVFIQRRIYPSLLLIIAVFALIILQLKQFRKLYEHIKNDRLEMCNIFR